MKTLLGVVPATALLLVLGQPAMSADLSKLDRTLAKEPHYVGQPKYCLLVFGPEAKTRVWLVVDDNFLYVDRNGNGDLTDSGKLEHFTAFRETGLPTIAEERDADGGVIFEGKLKHERLRVNQRRVKKDFVPKGRSEEELKALAQRNGDPVISYVSLSLEIRPRPSDPIPIAGRISQSASMDGDGFLQFADSPKDAPIIHFRGPLQMGLYGPQRLTAGAEPSDLQTFVGTPGLGRGTFASVGYFGLIGDEAQPVADIEFPSAVPGSTPLRAQYTLTHRC
jgi:hypothetical protein